MGSDSSWKDKDLLRLYCVSLIGEIGGNSEKYEMEN